MKLSDGLRASITLRMDPCAKCRKPRLSLRGVAKASGVNISTLSRFLAGKDVTSSVIDALDAWVKRAEL